MNSKKGIFSNRNIYLIISFTVLIALMTIGSILLGPHLVDAVKDPQKFRELLGTGVKSYFIFLGIQMAQIIFAFIPGELVEIGAGYVYGNFKGTVLCMLGSAVATFIIFGLTRMLGKKFTSIMIDSKDFKRLKFLQNEKNLELLFILLYFIPGTPKDLITYFAGVTKIKFGVFMVISTFCRIPSILTSTLVGSALGEERYLMSVIVFAITGVIAIIGLYVYHRISKKSSNEQK